MTLITKMHLGILTQTVAGLYSKLSLLYLGYVLTSLKAIARSVDFTVETCCSRCFISRAQEVRAMFATATPPIMH